MNGLMTTTQWWLSNPIFNKNDTFVKKINISLATLKYL